MDIEGLITSNNWIALANAIELSLLESSSLSTADVTTQSIHFGSIAPALLVTVYLIIGDHQSAKYTWKRYPQAEYMAAVSELGRNIITRDFQSFFKNSYEALIHFSSNPAGKYLSAAITSLVSHIRSSRLINLAKSYSTIRKDILVNEIGMSIQQLNEIQTQLKAIGNASMRESDVDNQFVSINELQFVSDGSALSSSSIPGATGIRNELEILSSQQLIKLAQVMQYLSSSIDGNIIKSTSSSAAGPSSG